LLSWRGKLDLFLERLSLPARSPSADDSIDAFARRRAGKTSPTCSPTRWSPASMPAIRVY